MAKITRYQGDLEAFGSNAVGQERVIFGDTNATQSDDLTDNINAALLRGWGALPLGNKPPREWFTSVHWVSTQLSAYLHQMGVAEWHIDQEYHKGSTVNYDGTLYSSLIDNNVGSTPSAASVAWAVVSFISGRPLNDVLAIDINVGTFVKTTGYFSDGDGGDNSYIVVAGGTGSNDGGSFIDLSNGNQLKALFSSGVANAAQFGAIPDGSDLTTELNAFFDIVNTGVKGEITKPGVYGLSDTIGVLLNSSFDVCVVAGAEFKALAGFPSNKKLLQFGEGAASNAVFKWVGGNLDGSEIPNSAPGEANDLFYFTAGANCDFVKIYLDKTYAGENWLTSGSDSHVFVVADNADLYIGNATGAFDAGIYISGDSVSSTIGKRVRVGGNFIRCNDAVVVKREYEDVDIEVFVDECLSGVGYTDDAISGGVEVQGGDGGVIKVTSRKTQRTAFVQGGRGVTIIANAIDVGTDITGYTSTAAKIINLEGAKDCKVIANISGMNPSITQTSAFVGVNMGDRIVDGSTITSENNSIEVSCRGIGAAVSESGGSDNNNISIKEWDAVAPPSVIGVNTIVEWSKDSRVVRAFGGALSNQYEASTTEVTEIATGSLNKEYRATSAIQWLIRSGASIVARAAYSITSGEWQWRAGGSGVTFTVDEVGPTAPSYTVASLPNSGVKAGTIVMAKDGRKAGEGVGAGTGVMVYRDFGTAQWRTFYDDTIVQD